MQMKIKKDLHPIPKGYNRYELPPECYILTSSKRHRLIDLLEHIKVSNGYTSNISKCITIKDRIVSGLRSHDCHVLVP